MGGCPTCVPAFGESKRSWHSAQPPPGLFPTLANDTRPTPSTSAPSKVYAQPNLITRYGLQSRLDESEDIKGKGKEVVVDRQDSLKERKARMILDARRSVLFPLGD
jgi:hypothetical protein